MHRLAFTVAAFLLFNLSSGKGVTVTTDDDGITKSGHWEVVANPCAKVLCLQVQVPRYSTASMVYNIYPSS